MAPDPFATIGRHNLAAQLRTERVAGIVAVAAKDFIPYLFGAWDCDVIAYPFDVVPRPIASHGNSIGLEIVFVTFTAAGARALAAAWPRIASILQSMANPTIPSGASMMTPTPSASASLAQLHLATWLLPPAWGPTTAAVASSWRQYISTFADAIDDRYSEIALALARQLPRPRAILQSCFSTDSHGHTLGPSAMRYQQSVGNGVDRARRLATGGFVVGVTSDHGGRDTRAVATYDRAAGTVAGAALPTAATHFKDGDHIVGYASAATTTSFWVSTPNGLMPFVVPPSVTARSYHPTQVPAWKVVGDVSTRIVSGARGLAVAIMGCASSTAHSPMSTTRCQCGARTP